MLGALPRGATRLYSSPWSLLLLFAQIAPLAAVALRAVSASAPLRLPPRRWLWLAGAFAAVVLASALLSPYRGPALLLALTPLAATAGFLLVHDALAAFPERLLRFAGWLAAAAVGLSFAEWLAWDLLPSLPLASAGVFFDLRNAYPFGHSNYTAGLAVLALPWLGASLLRTRGWTRAGWFAAVLVALTTLVSSGSRGGILGLVALVVAALFQARIGWRRLLLVSAIAGFAVGSLAFAHPRTRAMLQALVHRRAAPTLAASDLQRRAMLHAGAALGAARPLLGWGPGSTPLAYPRVRAELDGGVEDALQLHNTPVQLWAELGALGLLCAFGFLVLSARSFVAPPAPALRQFSPSLALAQSAAAVSFVGYGAFALTDFQLDLPFFALAVATCAALLAFDPRPAPPAADDHLPRRLVAGAAMAGFAVVALFGRSDPAPGLNTHALDLALEPGGADRAVPLLERSLALNPDQEIAHFNLGWLLLVRAPAIAESHFRAAARLVPDKGGVYFGLALARLNQDRPAPAARALALECLDDPAFLVSPWWREPAIAALRPAMLVELRALADRAADRLAASSDPRARDARYVGALAAWLEGRASVGEILGAAHSAERVNFFARRPDVPAFAAAPVLRSRRERTGYPVLMRQLDFPPPRDLYDVQDNALAAGEFKFLFPAKGWLPAPLLLDLLDSPPPPASSSPAHR